MSARVEWSQDGEVRSGLYWSPGPAAGTAWVIPDRPREGEGRAVCVKVAADGVAVLRACDVERSTAAEQSAVLERLRCRVRLVKPVGRCGVEHLVSIPATVSARGLAAAPAFVRAAVAVHR